MSPTRIHGFAAGLLTAVSIAAAPALAADLPPAALQKLDAVLADHRRDADRARDQFLHPEETLAFFGVTPDMHVVEAIPGSGWYARVLLPYLTPDGAYAAVGYSVGMTELMSSAPLSPARRALAAEWPERYLDEAKAYGPEGAPLDAAFLFGDIPASVRGQTDAVLFIGALHHLKRIGEIQYALADAYDMLKPGGVVGVVQHATGPRTPLDYDVSGALGYLRQTDVIKAFETAGFVFEAASDLNANPRDPADHGGGSYSMPPTGRSAATAGLGESNKMTLRFRKPL